VAVAGLTLGLQETGDFPRYCGKSLAAWQVAHTNPRDGASRPVRILMVVDMGPGRRSAAVGPQWEAYEDRHLFVADASAARPGGGHPPVSGMALAHRNVQVIGPRPQPHRGSQGPPRGAYPAVRRSR
jgi:hypothetical protein